jgi:hypothetical protein
MNYILAQFLSAFGCLSSCLWQEAGTLAARKSNEDKGWIQILVFVILAVFYALGSILKAKADKGAAKKKQTPGKALREPPKSTIEMRMLKQFFGLPEEPESETQPQATEPQPAKPQVARPQVQPTHRKVVRPQPAVRKPTIKTEEAVKIPTFEQQVQTKLEKVPGLTGTMPQFEAVVPAETPQAKYLSEILSDFDDSEKLRRAILHYEILGKPLSLRDPSEHIIGL